jgi:hypothetical protein
MSLTLDVVECVLRATERIELPEEINGSLGDGECMVLRQIAVQYACPQGMLTDRVSFCV